MADDESDESRPSLEPPKLFARKKKTSAPDDVPASAVETEPSAESSTEPGSILEPVPPPASTAPPVPDRPVKKAPARKTAANKAATQKTPAKKSPAAKKAPSKRAAAPGATAKQAPAATTTPVPAMKAPASETPPAEQPAATEHPVPARPAARSTSPVASGTEPGAPLFADEVEPTPAERATSVSLLDRVRAVASRTRTPSTSGRPETSPTSGEVTEKEPRPPLVTGYQAAALTGALVGLATVLLTTVTLRGCEAVRGTTTCGGPGFVLLLAIMIAMVLLGGLLLRLFQVSDPVSTSFLALGLVTVIALLFLIEVILSWTMVIVIPLIAVGTFCLSYWVTTTFVDNADSS